MSRQQLVSQASTQQLDALAKSYGFPSAKALQTVIQLGDHISNGGKITDQWMSRIQDAYPAVPRDHLNDLASQVRSLDDLARVVGVDPTVAKEYVTNYRTSLDSNAISQGLDSRVDTFRKVTPPTPSEAAARFGKPSTLRSTIEQQLSKQSIDLKDAPAPIRREVIAKGLERNADLRDLRAAQIINREAGQGSSSRAIDVALAYDQHVLTDTGTEELLTMDAEQGLQPADHELA